MGTATAAGSTSSGTGTSSTGTAKSSAKSSATDKEREEKERYMEPCDNVLPSHRRVMISYDALKKFEFYKKYGAGDDDTATHKQKEDLDPSAVKPSRSKRGGRSKNKRFRRKGRALPRRTDRTALPDKSGR